METAELASILISDSKLGTHFSSEVITSLAENLALEEYPKDTALMKEGEPACSLLIVISGEVRLSHES